MTLSPGLEDSYIARGPDAHQSDSTSSWDILYCSHIWTNSHLRNTIINSPYNSRKVVKYCYTCRGKIRKYEVRSPKRNFVPDTHSTPNRETINRNDLIFGNLHEHSIEDFNPPVDLSYVQNSFRSPSVISAQCIPTISHQVDLSFRQKYSCHEMPASRSSNQRLRKGLKGLGCAINFKLTDSPVKKRTQIQACSISVMIVAIVVISFVLVNFTNPTFTRASNVANTIVVPTSKVELNYTSSTTGINYLSSSVTESRTTHTEATLLEEFVYTTDNTLLSDVLSKIRKNIKTYPKINKLKPENLKPKDIINRDVTDKFCSCQNNEVCMLDESSGKSLCRKAVDKEDPTGCGGLCALDTEACQLVDKARGVRVCRLVSLVACSSEEWPCRNGLCVPKEARCNGSVQCYDRSDEIHCDCDLSKQFRCGHSISCFPNSKLCDGVIDCWDGFDEVNCTSACPDDKFTCTDGQCILSSRFCDGLADCADSSDEPQGCDGGCSAHEIKCANQRCIKLTNRCNGFDDCGDNTDEINCP